MQEQKGNHNTAPGDGGPANGDANEAESAISAGPWQRELTATGWQVTGPPARPDSDIRTLICRVPLGVNAQAISAMPELTKALRRSLEWVPAFLYREVEEPLVKAGVLQRHVPIDLTCSYPGCQISDGTVVKCDWCPQLVCTEHDDVLLNRDIDSDLTLCQPCGERYDHQATESTLKTLATALRNYVEAAPEAHEQKELMAALEQAEEMARD